LFLLSFHCTVILHIFALFSQISAFMIFNFFFPYLCNKNDVLGVGPG
jgi:hypothetical protein